MPSTLAAHWSVNKSPPVCYHGRVTEGTCHFQRARRPEQREARRQAILDAAAEMLAELPVTEISLRELSKRVGLAKSNVLRYFESREAVFLELLDSASRSWLTELPAEFATEESSAPPVEHVATVLARSLAARPLLCELISVTASVLERNISMDVARRFKLATADASGILAASIRERIPGLSEPSSLEFAMIGILLVAGLWPFANPTDQVRAAIDEFGLDVPHLAFESTLREAFTTHLTGLLARANQPLHG